MSSQARLHPRLLPSEAERRFAELAELPLEAAASHAAISDPSAVYAPTGAPRASDSEIEALQVKVREAAEEYGYPGPPTGNKAAAFDRAVAGLLLEAGGLFPAEAAAPEVWSFYALVVLPDVALWRWRGEDGKLNRERLIGSDLTRHAFARLWWRAYLLCVQTDGELDHSGLELLSVFGEADFDQIQSRRRAYGASPRVFQKLTKLWRDHREEIAEAEASDRVILRDLLMRLLRLGAFLRFDLLADHALEGELRRALDETMAGLDEQGSGGEPTGEPESGGDSADGSAGSGFDDIPLGRFVVMLTGLVEKRSQVKGRDLVSALENDFGVDVPSQRERWVTRFAWVAKGFEYLAYDKETDTWSIGKVNPAPDPRWGSWTMDGLRERAVMLIEGSGSPFDDLLGEAFDGARPSKFARHIIHTAVSEAEAPRD